MTNSKKNSRNNNNELSSHPFKDTLKNFSIGPFCLKCGQVIDSRPGWSLHDHHGSKKTQRQGFFHDECLTELELSFVDNARKLALVGVNVVKSEFDASALLDGVRPAISVPVFSQTEIDKLMSR